ncbi:PfkB family carbohydrate kinase [uncultured Roseibium sp.]|uniref:carbohydrate kinase family protein n=1 Tax=uncultured Roseibium sp. TaxID=1936171 RepID=UPI002634326C|nr:PfkB family carbohydrate kinase [uncultured Roseibium sp.]
MLHSDTSAQVLCIGRIYCDLVFAGIPRMPSLGSEVFAEGVSLHAGGGAFNTAAAFAALGWQTALSGVLPAAPFETVILQEGRERGLDLSTCTPAAPNASPQITVAIPLQGDRSFLSQKSGAAFPALNSSAPGFRSIRHLHIGELKSLCENPDVLGVARQAGWSISLDCGWDDALLARGAEVSSLVQAVDVFLPNQREFATLEASGLQTGGGPLVVVKEGASGATAIRAEGSVHAAANRVEVIDATGAGDAFNGGFLSAWLAREDVASCLAIGNRCGAQAVQSPGGAAWSVGNELAS